MKKYTYQDKNTGRKIFSDEKLKDRNLTLISVVRDGKMKSASIYKT